MEVIDFCQYSTYTYYEQKIPLRFSRSEQACVPRFWLIWESIVPTGHFIDMPGGNPLWDLL